MSDVCPRCGGTLDAATAGYSEHGLVCGPCHRELESALARQAGTMHVDTPDVELVNAAGVLAGLAVGVGFQLVSIYGGERISPSTHPEFFVYLRRGEQQVGPFHVRALARMWSLGGVRETDEYRYPGMTEWRPVTEFVPPGPR